MKSENQTNNLIDLKRKKENNKKTNASFTFVRITVEKMMLRNQIQYQWVFYYRLFIIIIYSLRLFSIFHSIIFRLYISIINYSFLLLLPYFCFFHLADLSSKESLFISVFIWHVDRQSHFVLNTLVRDHHAFNLIFLVFWIQKCLHLPFKHTQSIFVYVVAFFFFHRLLFILINEIVYYLKNLYTLKAAFVYEWIKFFTSENQL